MKHARSDYDAIQDPRPNGIPEDEPVFVIRAQDIVGPGTVRDWAARAEREGVSDEVVEAVRRHADAMVEWQHEHGTKVADVPAGALR